MGRDERDESDARDEARQQLPFEGLHVYQRVQEAWTAAQVTTGTDLLRGELESQLRQAVLGIARATARSRTNGHFGAELETARGALHAAAAVADQMARRGEPAEGDLRGLLVDSSRMLGALIRSVSRGPAEEVTA